LRPVYELGADRTVTTYVGELLILGGKQGAEQRVSGSLRLRFDPKATFSASVFVDRKTKLHMIQMLEFAHVRLPPGAKMTPPANTGAAPSGAQGEEWSSIHINQLISGDATAVHRLIFHITGKLTDDFLPRCDTDEGEQGQLGFSLPSWGLRMAALEEAPNTGFSFVVEAIPQAGPVTNESIDLLEERLFVLLGLVVGAEVGVGPVVGLDESDEVVWVHWGAPRIGLGSWRWCPSLIVDSALPALADGMSRMAQDPSLEKIVSRGLKYWMAANARGVVLDVKIPVACSGLELLAWGVLQQRQWVTADSFKRLQAGATLRLLLQATDIPADLPADYEALAARRAGYGNPADGGPELVFEVRNALVHPPKKLAKLEWPTHDELYEAWRLSMWYLELVIINLLGYQGEYVSRLRSGWFSLDPVPWAS
jgi:hypothetical protein